MRSAPPRRLGPTQRRGDVMSQPTVVEFDLDRYLRNSKKVDLSGIDWEEVPNHLLTDGDVMCLHYMMDIEAHTVIYLRDLLATRVAADRIEGRPRLRRHPHDVGGRQRADDAHRLSRADSPLGQPRAPTSCSARSSATSAATSPSTE